MKHTCQPRERLIEALKLNYPDCENITAPVELLSGRMYLNFTANRVMRGKQKQIDIPVLLSHCPFCGEKYESQEASEI